jgi:hypothetical protein
MAENLRKHRFRLLISGPEGRWASIVGGLTSSAVTSESRLYTMNGRALLTVSLRF